MPLIVALALLASSASDGSPRRDPVERRSACMIGMQVLSGLEREGPVILDGATLARPLVPDPGTDLAAATARAQPPSNIFAACPSLTSSVPANARWATSADRRDASTLPKPGELPRPFKAIVWISAPIFDGAKAYVVIVTRCAGLCGNGAVQSFVRSKRTGVWEGAGGRVAWVS